MRNGVFCAKTPQSYDFCLIHSYASIFVRAARKMLTFKAFDVHRTLGTSVKSNLYVLAI